MIATVALLTAVIGLIVAPAPAAQAATPAPAALILGDSVTPGVAPDASGRSLEEYAANNAGFATTVVTGAQWDAMTAAQFAHYQVLIIGDPTCDPSVGGATWAAAIANQSVWEPVVMASGGNKTLIGTDPTYHYRYSSSPGDKVEQNGIAYAGAIPGSTGAYIDLSCVYTFDGPGTPVPILDGLSTHGSGQFTVISEGYLNACATGVNVVAQSGPTTGLTDAQLSNWNCSVHEAFDKYPSDYTPLALAPTSSGFPATYCAIGVFTGTQVCGAPYIMVSGSGVSIRSDITLTPSNQTLAPGGSASLVAHVSTGGSPVSGGSVTFQVSSGPNVGKTLTGSTDASGNVTFTYADTGGAGTDNLTATYIDSSNLTQQALASVNWSAALCTVAEGSGSNGSGTGMQTVTNEVTTNLKQTQEFNYSWGGGAHTIELTQLTSATCGRNDRKPVGLTFIGIGTAVVDDVAGVPVRFAISGSTGGWYVTVQTFKGSAVTTHSMLLTTNNEAIS
jgi:hypothetical protein